MGKGQNLLVPFKSGPQVSRSISLSTVRGAEYTTRMGRRRSFPRYELCRASRSFVPLMHQLYVREYRLIGFCRCKLRADLFLGELCAAEARRAAHGTAPAFDGTCGAE